MNQQDKIYVAGHRGMVGSAIVRQLCSAGFNNLVVRSHAELDLCDQAAVQEFMRSEQIDHVVLAAARVGGIHANNNFPADFIRDNLSIQLNVIDAAYRSGVKRLLFLGSSCIYPRMAKQPIQESALLTGPLEPTNEPYAIAKIAGIKLCESYNRQYGTHYRSLMPTNLYGPGDNFDLNNSHVIPALIRKFHDARVNGLASVIVWGTGTPRREFLHVDDMAAASVHVMRLADSVYSANTKAMLSHINVGAGADISISELAKLVKEVVGYEGGTQFDSSMPDGAPRKLMDVSRINALGWSSSIGLREGLMQSYNWFVQHQGGLRS